MVKRLLKAIYLNYIYQIRINQIKLRLMINGCIVRGGDCCAGQEVAIYIEFIIR